MRCPTCGRETAISASGRCTLCGESIAAGIDVATIATPPAGSRVTGPLTAGQAFGPRYHILRVLGAGGMGVVYQAWDAELGVAVALKVIRPEVLEDPSSAGEVERRFKRELVLARQVTHKHVVRIHDLGELNGIKYLTMPFVEGENLADVLKREGKLPVPRALAIAKQVASGLAAAHEVGVVHRDLKPENIMIAADDGALIMDFGISRSVSGTGTMTAMGAIMGTLEYMAPEQAQGEPVDHRADLYSFGLLVYDMLTGRQRIARRDNPMSEMMSRMVASPPPVRSLEAQVPEPFERVITRCLQPSPKARYAATADLVRDLDALAPDGHVLAAVKGAGTSRAALYVMATALVAVLVGSSAWIWRTGGQAPAAAIEPVSVLIANFENRAREPLFDGLVEQALGVGIEGASFVSAYPRRDALRLVAQVKREALDEETARLIAIREGIDRIVSGSIEADGSRYKLAVKIVDPTEGRALLTWDTRAGGKDEILNAVGRAAAKVREGLGDTTVNAEQVRDAETFTAASIEAAHEYVAGQELQWAGKYEDAIAAYLKAVKLDGTLGRAYAGLGAVSNSLGRRDEAIGYYKQAMTLIERMTPREKYRTRGGYYLLVRDPAKAREQLEALVKEFPADSTGLSNLAVASFLNRDMRRALEVGRQASAIYPKNVLRRNNVALFAMYSGEFAEAEQEANGVLELNKEFAKAYLVIAISQLAQGRSAEAEATWQRLREISTAGRDFAAHGRADMAIYEGRLADAARILEDEIATPPATRSGSTTARLVVTLAEVRQQEGRTAEAITLADEALARRGSEQSVSLLAGLVFARAGRSDRALALATALGTKLDSEAQMYGHLIEGEVNLQKADARAAVASFTEAQKHAKSWLGYYGLGRAYLAGGVTVDAQTAFDQCVARKGEATTVLLDDIPTFRLMALLQRDIARARQKTAPQANASRKFAAPRG